MEKTEKYLLDPEEFSLEELVRAAEDKSVKMPSALHQELSELIDGLDAVERVPRRRLDRMWMAGIAAAVAVAVVLGVDGYRNRTPKDTFSNPDEALAFVERTFTDMSERFEAGLQFIEEISEDVSSGLEIFRMNPDNGE